ncbi:hypothetical protein [Helicobacter pylori]|uniref:hypothetical protein n=1 Tax=Helicobacter pylori TaxID=210 RepID=UPI002159D5F4|nr:hypothetical protein [Helicobacter pylori]
MVSGYHLSHWPSCFSCFFIKREHHSSNNPNNSQKAVLKKLKNPSHKKPQELKNSNNRSN